MAARQFLPKPKAQTAMAAEAEAHAGAEMGAIGAEAVGPAGWRTDPGLMMSLAAGMPGSMTKLPVSRPSPRAPHRQFRRQR